ncbi:MAG: hypothetical protein EOQ49_23025 [Mesorhizobium sp.]|uniref:hypothetical protein n=1 Tax=Mesorhizobium sp. M3A.F.Ca.ET.080.04.2.1 TaxID=2493676 RepID=UPI000FE971B1|nr:hypothetical protein [Mesorhizobium sp. M3A.F.Ca.ET.080.04.2.1]RWB68424.1 MAG: hypothetical protein EOQ49_23025 [Mesorhizobium sp.]TGT59532.1 hypothetical protein EN813_028455 [Mesorhizobium sp. M00.F.Ca.ET.170.01.1.1]
MSASLPILAKQGEAHNLASLRCGDTEPAAQGWHDRPLTAHIVRGIPFDGVGKVRGRSMISRFNKAPIH